MIPCPAHFRAPDGYDRVLAWLREEDERALEALWRGADSTREAHVGDEVHLRGLVEISNHCTRACTYCGIRAPRRGLARYRMEQEDVLPCAHAAAALGYGTVVLQAGEDDGLERTWVAALVGRIREETGLAVTLSLGERSEGDLAAWREAGAERYLLRFETSDEALYRRIHPPRSGRFESRITKLERLRALGYEIGSGVMVGIPGQTWESLARDVMCFGQLDLDMIGVGPFLPHPQTPLGRMARAGGEGQVSNTEGVVYRVLALARLVCPQANIPSTTALATVNRTSGRQLGLARGANVVMPNLTPTQFRGKYEIYPGKACAHETANKGHEALLGQIASLGRRPGTGPGARVRTA